MASSGVITLVAGSRYCPRAAACVDPRSPSSGADLFDSGGTTINGKSFVAEAIKEIEAQLDPAEYLHRTGRAGGRARPSPTQAGTSVWTASGDSAQPRARRHRRGDRSSVRPTTRTWLLRNQSPTTTQSAMPTPRN